MDPGTAANIGLVLAGVGVLLAVLTFLDFKLPGPHLVARLWARIQAPRKEREELRKMVVDLQKKTDDQATLIVELIKTNDRNLGLYTQLSDWLRDLQADATRLEGRVADMEKVLEKELGGQWFNHRPEAERVRQAGKTARERDDK